MSLYNAAYARVYAMRGDRFNLQHAPAIQRYYESLGGPRSLLDLMCGTGELVAYFAGQGYICAGLDASPGMLAVASQINAPHIESGAALLGQGDVRDFHVGREFGLITATYGSINHLPDQGSLRACFRAAFKHLLPGGLFLFDLNTRLGLLNGWNTLLVEDSPSLTVINRAIFTPESDQAINRITGYLREGDGSYTRFEQTMSNTVFAVAEVIGLLREAGFSGIRAAPEYDLRATSPEPEAEGLVWIMGQK